MSVQPDPGASDDQNRYAPSPQQVAQVAGGDGSTNASNHPSKTTSNLVPTWKVRPEGTHAPTWGMWGDGKEYTTPSGMAGTEATEQSDNMNDSLSAMNSITGMASNFFADLTGEGATTEDDASSQWYDMSASDRADFEERALAVGLLSSGFSPADAFAAWTKMCSDTAAYNANQSSSKGYISPWVAINRLAGQRDAATGNEYDGLSGPVSQAGSYTTSEEQSQHYNLADIESNAKQILQSELGRDPTKGELKGYLIAINKAGAANPETQKTTYTTNAAGKVVNTSTVQSGGIDPNSIIDDAVTNTNEHRGYEAAATYLPALQQALQAVI